jgi:hypothetical protein
MLRYLTALLLLAALCAAGAPPAAAAGPAVALGQRQADDISGTYINRSNGGECEVYARGRGYVFVNENGSKARFVFTRPGRLEMTAGDWDPSVVVTVQRGRGGRTVLRFDSGKERPGSWVRDD